MNPLCRAALTRRTHCVARFAASPLVAMFVDLHWIDGQTQELLDALADSIANARVLLLVNCCSECRHE